VSVAAIEVAGDVRQTTQLGTRQGAVGHGDPQHRRQPLNVQAVAQPQVQELGIRQGAVEIAAGLGAVVLDALCDELAIELVVLVHGGQTWGRGRIRRDSGGWRWTIDVSS
jgi:hypothetical protein